MGGWWRSADLREGCALAHSGGRCAPERLRAWTLRDSGRVPLSSQKNAKGGGPRTQLATFVAQTSVLGPPTYFPASQEETSSLHPGSSVPGCPSALCIGGMREGKEGCGGRDGIGGSQTIRGALWAPRHREIVDVKLKKA